MKPDASRKRGAELRRQVLGEPYTGNVAQAGSRMRREFADAATEHVWDSWWSRPGLDLRARVVLTIALLMTRGTVCEETLGLQIRGAVTNQLLTRDEVMELILHCTSYAGFPAGRAALRVALRVLPAA